MRIYLSVAIVWVVRGEASNPSWGSDVEVDRTGNIYVAGSRYNGSNWDLVTLSYAPNGERRFITTFDRGGDESATGFRHGLVVSSTGQVYVAANFNLVAYDADGRERWTMIAESRRSRSTPPNLVVTSPTAGTERLSPSGTRTSLSSHGGTLLALSAQGDIYLGGVHMNGFDTASWDIEVARLDPSGTLASTKRYDNGAEDSARVAVDAAGALYVTGTSWSRAGIFSAWRADYITLKYDRAGQLAWNARLTNLGAGARSKIAVAPDGRVTVTGTAGTTVQYRQVPAKKCLWIFCF